MFSQHSSGHGGPVGFAPPPSYWYHPSLQREPHTVSWCYYMMFLQQMFREEKLPASRTRFFIDLCLSRSIVFCCTSSVYTGVTQDRLPYLIVAPRKGCDSSSRTMVIGIGEVIDSRSLFPAIINNLLLPNITWAKYSLRGIKTLSN